jgi:8-oxo-dGTP diphosphatase
MTKTQRPVVTAFIHHKGRVLLAKRHEKCKLFPGQYELPGGKVDFGETPEQALEREIMEELAVRVKTGRPFYCFSYESPDGQTHYVETVFIVGLLDPPEKVKMIEHTDLKWASQNEVQGLDMSDQAQKAALLGFSFI